MAKTNYLKGFKLHQILLFIICGILVVLFLNYNNISLYVKSSKYNQNTENVNYVNNILSRNVNENIVETFKSKLSNTTLNLPTFNNYEINSSSYDNIYYFLKILSPSDSKTDDGKLNAIYNKLYISSLDIVNNLNNKLYTEIYNVSENKYNNKENVFVSKVLDIRKDKTKDYALQQDLISIPLKFEYGITLDIDFIMQFSYNINPAKIPSKIKITEIPTSEYLIKSEKSKYNTYILDSFKLETIPTIPEKYILIFDLPDYIHNNNIFKQKLLLNLFFNNLVVDSNIDYKSLITKLNILKSTMTYNIEFNNEIIFSTDINFIVDRLNLSGPLKTYTENEIENIFTDTLNDKYNKIVTPLFELDNNLSKKEKEINTIKQHYFLNELSNYQNNIKFFNNYK